MAELSTEYAWTCCTNEHWETAVKGSSGDYTVAWGQLFGKPLQVQMAQYGWTCTCWPFKKSGSTCKHIQKVEASGDRCGWNGELEPTAVAGQDDDGNTCCPECKGPVTSYRVGV